MKLAFFVANYPVPSETFVIRQIKGMLDLGHDVTIITGHHDLTIDDPLAGKARVQAIRSEKRGTIAQLMFAGRVAGTFLNASPKKGWRKARSAIQGIKGGLTAPIADIASAPSEGFGQFDAIIAHFGPAGVRAMYLRSAGLLSGPIATVFHGLDLTEHSLVKRFMPHYQRLFRETEVLLPISELWKQRLIGWGAEPSKITVHRMGVDVADFPLTHKSRTIGQPLKILSTARLVQKKGLQFAIEAMAKLPGDAHLTIIGYGPLEQELREAAKACSSRVTFLGKVPHQQVMEELKQADVFLLPSIIADNGDMEGIPVSLMEAMALGVTTVSTWHSGIPELITDRIEGFLVPERDAGEIAKILKIIDEEGVDIKSVRVAARAKVEQEFDNDKLDVGLEMIAARMSSAWLGH